MLGYDISIPAVLLRRRALTATAPLEGDTLPADADIDWRLAIFATTAAGLAATDEGEIFLVPATGALGVWSHLDGTAEPIGQVARIEFGTLAALAAYDGPALPAGLSVRTRTEGYVYETLAAGVAADLIGADGTRWRILPDGDGVWDRQFFTIANDADRVNAAIQWTIDRQIAEGTVYKVKVHGLYTMDKPIRAFRFTGTAFQFVSVHIEAPAQGYVNNRRTQFRFTDGQNPGLVTQAIRQLTLRNIALIGAANDLVLPSYDALLDRNGWWNVNNAAQTGQYRLHAGVCIDPFTTSVPAAERFPAFDGSGALANHYVVGTGGGSTQILVEHCDVQGWIVAINCAASPVQVGDSITIDRCNLSYNRNCVVIGESQNRGIAVNDCHAKGFDVMFAAGSGFSTGTGAGNYVNGGVYVFGYAMLNMDTNRGPGALTNVYAESIWTLGNITGGKAFQITNCKMKLIRNWNGRGVASVLMGGGNVTFDGGYVGAYDNLPNQIAMGVRFTVQGGATFDAPPVCVGHASGGLFHWVDGRFRYVNGDGVLAPRLTGSFGAVLGFPAYALPGMPFRESPGETGYWECLSGPGELLIGTATAARAGGTVTLTGIDTANIFVGDTLVSGTSQNIRDHRGGTVSQQFYVLGRVASIDTGAGSCTLSGGAVEIEHGKAYTVYIMTYPTVRRPRQATRSQGSTQLTGAGIVASEWPVGTPIRGPGIAPNTRVAARAAGQITLTKPATSTGTGDIFDGLFLPATVHRAAPPTGGSYHAGSFIRNAAPVRDASNMILAGWTCTAGGAPGTWEPVYMSAVSPAT